jgi:hypothetical protein
MRKLFVAVCGGVLLVGSASAQTDTDNHLRDFRRKLIWKAPLIKTAFSALFNEARNSPHEWGRGVDGFGKRVASSFGQRAVKATVELGVSSWTHEDLHYKRMGPGGFWSRIKHAAVTTYWVPRDNGQGQTVAIGRITGSFAAGMVSRTWMPSRVATFGAGMQSFGGSIGLDVGVNIFREFWPRKH